jgi:hypothetical protein
MTRRANAIRFHGNKATNVVNTVIDYKAVFNRPIY